jgi:hypothetical protein
LQKNKKVKMNSFNGSVTIIYIKKI